MNDVLMIRTRIIRLCLLAHIKVMSCPNDITTAIEILR